jgi:hypothetical protein
MVTTKMDPIARALADVAGGAGGRYMIEVRGGINIMAATWLLTVQAAFRSACASLVSVLDSVVGGTQS